MCYHYNRDVVATIIAATSFALLFDCTSKKRENVKNENKYDRMIVKTYTKFIMQR